MPLLNDVHSIIYPAVSATTAGFSAYSFTEIYAGAAATPVINGVAVTMAAGSTLRVKIASVTSGTNCFLLGEKINTLAQDPNIYTL